MGRAVRIHRFGGTEVLKLEDLPPSRPGADEVLIRVHAASVNPVDYKIRRDGKYPVVTADHLPVVLGRDASGIVEAVGPEAERVQPGQAVYVMLRPDQGAYCDYTLAQPADLAAQPRGLDHVQAAAIPLAGLTAWQGLFDHGGLRAGQRVLIHGGTGGVGHFAVQFAHARGAYVVTTTSAEGAGLARELGADEVIDYKHQRFEELVHDIDVVFDLIAGETQERSWPVLKRGGILVSTLTEPSQEKARVFGVRGTRYTAQPSGAQLTEIAALIEAGKVRPVVARVFPLEQAAQAQDTLEREHVKGKIVLRVAD